MTHFDVTPGEIRAHAADVSRVAQTLGQMQEASSVSGDSYGLLLQWLPGAINAVIGDVEGALDSVARNADHAVNGLKAMADQYEADDVNASWQLRGSYP
ncbi:hypothetical protein JQN72_14320 [Phycicoccus sp. CSK15P-2]|uniref:type VII secretion target n=1 Tax=Phycicoccus sp. CSK15P-2 TaxID=2807627 RepID=UPI0019519439|nr:type VII secretion target [Phycicoccus sp. CSK15P-2]MBM6405417.1 hypothetical protein [Phycicoccus sp. CSK15P-2]